MKKTIRTILCIAAFAVLAVSCQKENNEVEPIANSRETIEISINGLMGEYTQVDATKSSLVNTVRVSWEKGDVVYVYDGTQCLGSLVASLDENGDDRYAFLSTDETHTVTAPAAGTKLTLVHSPLLTEAPSVSEGAISISLAEQSGTKAPFVAYATLDYNNEESITNALVPFKFATSVIKVNCTGLKAGTAIDNATLSNVNTACKLTLSRTSAPTVDGDVNGTITRTGDAYFEASKVNADCEAVFQIAVPKLETASKARVLAIMQGSESFIDRKFTTKSLLEATSVNTVCQLVEVHVERVSLDRATLSLNEGTTYTLAATVYPDYEIDKSVTWSSSNDRVATVDDSGTVSAISLGIATITVTTNSGLKTATCAVTVYKAFSGDMPGKFTINEDGDQVQFSKGNLWADNSNALHFEGNQYVFNSYYETSHVSFFTWSDNVASAVGTECSGDYLFCDDNHKVSVDGSGAIYYALSSAEWEYLFCYRKMPDDRARYENVLYGITIEGVPFKGIILFPDGFERQAVWRDLYTTWDALNKAGLVFLPATGYRSEYPQFGSYSLYWSSTPFKTLAYSEALDLLVDRPEDFSPVTNFRSDGCSIRLVTDVTE